MTEDSVSLRRTWPRAMAVGARGLQLEVDKETGVVLSARPLGGPK